MVLSTPNDLTATMKRKGFVDTIPRPLPPMKFRTEIEEFCVRLGVITRQRLTSLRSLCILITPLSVEQSSTRGWVALLTCGNKVETCRPPRLKFQSSIFLALHEPSHVFSAGKGRSERQTFKAAFRRISPQMHFDRARSLVPVSFSGPVYSPSRPHFGLALHSARRSAALSLPSFHFAGELFAVFRVVSRRL